MNITGWDFSKTFMGLFIEHIIFWLLMPSWYNSQLFSTEVLTRSQYLIMILGFGPILFGGWAFFTIYIEVPYFLIKKKIMKDRYLSKMELKT
jgi:hypothetical protein